MKKSLSILLMLIAVCSLVFASGSKEAESSDSGKITLTMTTQYTAEESVTDNTRRMPRETILEYAELNADSVELKMTDFQHNDYETKVQALAAANDLPDVFQMKGSWVKNFYNSGLVADITSFVEDCEWLDEYRDGLYYPVTIDGVIVGVPMQFSTTSVVYYNKDLWASIGYDEFPATWEEVFAAVPKFKAMGIDTIAFGNSSKWQFNSSWVSTLAARFTGAEWVDNIIAENGKASFTDAKFVEFLAFVEKIGKSGVLNPDYAVIDNQKAASLLLQGKAAATIDGYWNVEYSAGVATEDVLDNIGFAYMPTAEGTILNTSILSSGCGWFLGINSALSGEKLAKAAELALYVSGPKLSQRMTDIGLISTSKTEPSEGIVFDKLHNSYLECVANAETTVPIWDANMGASVIATMNDQYVELLAGRTTPEKAAKAIQAEYEASL